MIELFIALLIIPAVTIGLWDRLMLRMSVNAKRVYRLTGYVGVPVHELAHALVCIAFGMRIKRMSFYQPNSASGTMGFVEYRYSPYSMRHAIGRTLQGIAPLMAGAGLVALLLGSVDVARLPDTGVVAIASWIPEVAGSTISAASSMLFSGGWGVCAVVLAMIISMHAIPSVADILSGVRGLSVTMIFTAAAVLAFELLWTFESEIGARFGNVVEQIVGHIENGLWVALFGAVSMVTMAMVGGVVLILVPTLCLYVVAFIRGARGKI